MAEYGQVPRSRSAESEETLVSWLARRGLRVGDDTGAIPLAELRGELAVTTDSQIAGVHHPSDLDPWLIAQRLLRVNLSDLAAAAATPQWITCNLNAPLPQFDWRRFFTGLIHECARYEVELIGGDCAASPNAVLSLTALGVVPPERTTPRRDGASSGDSIWVSGSLGEAALGLDLQQRGAQLSRRGVRLPPGLVPRHLEQAARRAVTRHRLPEPALAQGDDLGRLTHALAGGDQLTRVACIDVSDGLAKDLARLCDASGVAARIDIARLPLASRARDLAKVLSIDLERLVLGGGEDYVLLFTLPPGAAPPAGCHRIGEVVSGKGIQLENDGMRLPAHRLNSLTRGWDHLG